MTDRVFVDASERFAARRQMATFDTHADGLEVILNTMEEQPADFIKFVRGIEPVVAEALGLVRGTGMDVKLAGIEADIVNDEERVLPHEEYGVFYVKGEQVSLKPVMYLSKGMVSEQFNRLGPLFSGYDNDNMGNLHLGGTVAASCWMALGKWAIDTIDPRMVNNPEYSTASLRALGSFTGIDPEVIDLNEDENRIGEVMTQVTYRMAGGMAYAGLARYLRKHRDAETMGPEPHAISIMQAVLQNYVSEQLARDGEKITSTDFALAFPLKKVEVIQVFQMLGPVARELKEQGGLPTLN